MGVFVGGTARPSEVRSDWPFACNEGGGNPVVCPIVSPSNAGDGAFRVRLVPAANVQWWGIG